MLTDEEIYLKISDILLQISPSMVDLEIKAEMSLINDLSIDSIKIAELSILLEDAFHSPIFIPDLLSIFRDPNEITVSALVEFVKQQLQP